MAGLDAEGELYAKIRRRVGVDGGAVVDEDAMGRVGEAGLWGEGGVTSVCSIDVKIALACSEDQSVGVPKPDSKRLTFESIRLGWNNSIFRRCRWSTFVHKVVGCAHVSPVSRRDEPVSIVSRDSKSMLLNR